MNGQNELSGTFLLGKLNGTPQSIVLNFVGLPSPSQLHFRYTNFSCGRGFAFHLHTLPGDSYANLRKIDVSFEKQYGALTLAPKGNASSHRVYRFLSINSYVFIIYSMPSLK